MANQSELSTHDLVTDLNLSSVTLDNLWNTQSNVTALSMGNESELFTHDLISDLDLNTVTLDYLWGTLSNIAVPEVTSSAEDLRVAQLIDHYITVARNIWRIWSPIALGEFQSFF